MTNHTLQESIFKTGTAVAGASVILGAFGAHALKESISPEMMSVYEKAVKYQFYHALGLVGIASMMRYLKEQIVRLVYLLFIVGMILFCGSLYMLSTREILLGNALQWIGFITPLGGLSLISGWIILARSGYQIPDGINRGSKHKHRSDRNEE